MDLTDSAAENCNPECSRNACIEDGWMDGHRVNCIDKNAQQ